MNASPIPVIDPQHDQSQVYQWEESYKKRKQHLNQVSHIKIYNDAEPERPRQLYTQRLKIEGQFGLDQHNQTQGDGISNLNNGLKQEQNNNSGRQSNIKHGDNSEDSRHFENHLNKNQQINNPKNVQPHSYKIQNNNIKEVLSFIPNMNLFNKNQSVHKNTKGNSLNQISSQNRGDQPDQTINLQFNQDSLQYNYKDQHNNQDLQDNQGHLDDGDNDENYEDYDNDEDNDYDNNDENYNDNDDDDQNNENEEKGFPFLFLKEMISLKRRIKQEKRIIVDLSQTHYDVIKDVCDEMFGWQIQTNANNRTDYNMQWIDSYLQEEDFRRMLPFQKINHFPGSQQLGKKNLLGQNLQKMRNIFEQNYNFYPLTWVLPLQYDELTKHYRHNTKRKPYYIVKPDASCQGRGIYLTNNIQQFENTNHYIVQEYIKKPYLIDDLKFDLRLYVLIKSIYPLKIFLFQEGLARFATVPYQLPNQSNINNLMMHLTNYALNKKNPHFIQNQDSQDDDIGHKRSFSSVLKHLHDQGHDVDTLLMEIRQIIIKAIISAQPQMSHLYRTCQPKNDGNEMCFEVLGFDIMIDEDLKPYLIEVNHTPSFQTDSPLDLQVKKNLIIDTLNLINVTNKTKKKYYDMRVQQQIESRSLHRKKYGTILNARQEDFDEEIIQQEYNDWEEENMGAYIRIYPSSNDPLNYNQFLQASGNAESGLVSTKKKQIETQENQNIFHTSMNNQYQQQYINPSNNTNNYNQQSQYSQYIQYQQYQQQMNLQKNNQSYKLSSQIHQQTQGYSLSLGECQQDYSYQMMTSQESPQRPQIRFLGPQQNTSDYKNAIKEQNKNLVQEQNNIKQFPHNRGIHSQINQIKEFQQMNENIPLSSNQENKMIKRLSAVGVAQQQTTTPAKVRQSGKSNTQNAQQNGIANYSLNGSSYPIQAVTKLQQHQMKVESPQVLPLQQPSSLIFHDSINTITNYTYAEPTKPSIIGMESPQQIIKSRRNLTISQQKSLVLNQAVKNVNGLKLQPVDKNSISSINEIAQIRKETLDPTRNRITKETLDPTRNRISKETLDPTKNRISKDSLDPTRNRIRSSQSFHQARLNSIAFNETNQNTSMNTIQQNNDQYKARKLVNTQILDATLQLSSLRNQNSHSSFKKVLDTHNSTNYEDNHNYNYQKKMINSEQIEYNQSNNKRRQEGKKNSNNSMSGAKKKQVHRTEYERAASLVSDRNINNIQRIIKEDIYPHNIKINFNRLNSLLQHQNTDVLPDRNVNKVDRVIKQDVYQNNININININRN